MSRWITAICAICVICEKIINTLQCEGNVSLADNADVADVFLLYRIAWNYSRYSRKSLFMGILASWIEEKCIKSVHDFWGIHDISSRFSYAILKVNVEVISCKHGGYWLCSFGLVVLFLRVTFHFRIQNHFTFVYKTTSLSYTKPKHFRIRKWSVTLCFMNCNS